MAAGVEIAPMKITICGSMSFAKEMLETKAFFESRGHTCFLPHETDAVALGKVKFTETGISAGYKIEHDLITKHYQKIQNSDVILVLNYTKNNIENYIGGNTFLEMGFAHVLGKKIYLLNSTPDIRFFQEEIDAMRPTILQGQLSNLV